MKRFAKRKKKIVSGQIVAQSLLDLPKGPIHLALSRINIYLKYWPHAALVDCAGCSGENGQQGVGQAPNPLRSHGSGPDMASRRGAQQPQGKNQAGSLCVQQSQCIPRKPTGPGTKKCHNLDVGVWLWRRSGGHTVQRSPNVLVGLGHHRIVPGAYRGMRGRGCTQNLQPSTIAGFPGKFLFE